MKNLLLFTTLLLSVIAVATSTAVRDTNGKPVRAGVEYYIWPAFTDVAGGLILDSRKELCPLYVAQATSPTNFGGPLTFSQNKSKSKAIKLNTDTIIEFTGASICVQSLAWRLTLPDETTSKYFVSTGGEASKFKVVENSGDYNLVHCPTVCDTCRPICGNLGIIVENGKRWLGFTDRPFPFRFVRVDSV